MDDAEIKRILGDTVQPDGSLFNGGWYVSWKPGDKDITLDAEFTIEDLEAIVAHMKKHSKKPLPHA